MIISSGKDVLHKGNSMKVSKKTVAIGLFCVLAVIGLWAFFHKGAEPKTFMDEVKAARAKNEAATQVPIHDLVLKYIPVGTKKETALNFCRANGLKINPVPAQEKKRAFPNIDPKTYDEAVSCSVDVIRWELLWHFWIGSDTVLVILGMKDGVVVWAGGAISFTSL